MPNPVEFTGTTVVGSAVISSVSDTTGLAVGSQVVSGTGIPGSAKILSVGSGTITLSQNATAAGTGGSLSAQSAQPGFTLLTGQNIYDNGKLLVAGTLSLEMVTSKGAKGVGARAGGSKPGQLTVRPITFPIENGAIMPDGTFITGTSTPITPQLADVSETFPEFFGFIAKIFDPNSDRNILGGGYLLQPSGAAFNFDTFDPNQPGSAMIQTGPSGPAGQPGGAGQYAIGLTFTGVQTIRVTHNLGILAPMIALAVSSSASDDPAFSANSVDENNTDLTSYNGSIAGSFLFVGGTYNFPTPVIITQPADESVSSGATATFVSAASGSPIPTVQWESSTDSGATWSNVGGATSPTYTTGALTSGDSGTQYRAVFSNTGGSATTVAATVTIVFSTIVPSGLLSLWAMDEGTGTTFADPVGSNTLTATGVTFGTVGQDGFAGKPALFDRATSFATAANISPEDFTGSSAFSVSAWINPSSVSGGASVRTIMTNADDTVGPGWQFSQYDSSLLFSLTGTGGGIVIFVINILTASTLQHVAFTYDGSGAAAGVKVYLNGVLQTNSVNADTFSGSAASGLPMLVGAAKHASGLDAFFGGALGFGRIYSRALSSGEITTLYNSGVPA